MPQKMQDWPFTSSPCGWQMNFLDNPQFRFLSLSSTSLLLHMSQAAVLVSTILRVIDLSLHNATHFLVFPFGIWVTALRFRASACGGNLKI